MSPHTLPIAPTLLLTLVVRCGSIGNYNPIAFQVGLDKGDGKSEKWKFERAHQETVPRSGDKYREISMSINAGCDLSASCARPDVSLINLTVTDEGPNASCATGDGDVDSGNAGDSRWIWAALGYPTVHLAITKPRTPLVIDWAPLFGDGDLDSCLRYVTPPLYSASVMLYRLVEFDDVNNTAVMPAGDDVDDADADGDADDANDAPPIRRVYPLHTFAWNRTVLRDSADGKVVRFSGSQRRRPKPADCAAEHGCAEREENAGNSNDGIEKAGNSNGGNAGSELGRNATLSLTGTINITLSAFNFKGLNEDMPHLPHSGLTNQVDIVLDDLHSDSGFWRPRFALQLVIVANTPKRLNIKRRSVRTVNDENTPGIFSSEELLVPGPASASGGSGGARLVSYLQWKPVAYLTAARSLTESTFVNVSPPADIDDAAVVLSNSTVFAVYGEELENLLAAKVDVVFGAPGDGGYNKRKFLAWTFNFGSGEPIQTEFSWALIMVMGSLFGISALCFAVAAIFCAYKKCSAPSHPLVPSDAAQSATPYVRLLTKAKRS